RRQDRAHAVRRLARRALLGVLAALALGAGCRTAAEQFTQAATERGLHADVIMGEGFQHLVLSTPGPRGAMLHVYLDGDGTPTLSGHPAADPTPRDPLVLDLMTLDSTPS